MVSDELKNYVVDNLREGWEKEELEKSLLEAGWPEDEVKKVFAEDDVRSLFLKQNESPSDGDKNIESEEQNNGLQNGQLSYITDVDPPPQKNSEPLPEEEIVNLPEMEDPPKPKDVSYSVSSKMRVDLGSYIKNSLEKGFSESAVKSVAGQAGWSDAEIERTIKEVKGS
ncbi:MAG: hypothetical protein ACQEP6_01395 [Patescibacteria group bacterium]